jgi:hypothetical protein
MENQFPIGLKAAVFPYQEAVQVMFSGSLGSNRGSVCHQKSLE